MNNDVIELLSDSSEEEEDDGVANNAENQVDFLLNIGDTVHVTVMGPPKAKPRPAFMAWMRGGRMLRRVVNNARPEQTIFRDQFIQTLESEYNLQPLTLPVYHHQPIDLEITFYRKLPVTFFINGDREQGLKQPHLLNTEPLDIKVPDIDNLAKFVMDALNGVLYTDDRQIVRLTLKKTYHMFPPFTGMTRVGFKASAPNYVF